MREIVCGKCKVTLHPVGEVSIVEIFRRCPLEPYKVRRD